MSPSCVGFIGNRLGEATDHSSWNDGTSCQLGPGTVGTRPFQEAASMIHYSYGPNFESLSLDFFALAIRLGGNWENSGWQL